MSDNTSIQIPPDPSVQGENIRFRQQDLRVIQSLGQDNLGYAWLVIDPLTANASPEQSPDDSKAHKATQTPDSPPPQPRVLKTIVGLTPKDSTSFERDFQTLARLDHPGLVRFRHLEITPENITYTRDYTEGLDFLTYLRRPATERERHDLQIRLNDGEATHLHTTDVDLNASTTTNPELEPVTIELDVSDLEPVQTSLDDEFPLENQPLDQHAPLDLIFLRLEHLLPQLLSVLEYLHRFRRAHGNLTPTSIHIDANDTLHISDFGLRRQFQTAQKHTDPSSENAPKDTSKNPTELALDQAADLYALGCLLFDAIAPSRPKDQDFQRESLLAVQPHCPASWTQLVQELLHPQANQRPGLQQIRRLIENSVARSVALPPTRIDEQSTFFGRNDILETLLETTKDTAANRNMHLVFLTGPVGVGKAALLDLLAYSSAQTGWLVLRGACYQTDVTLYQGFSEIASQLAKICQQLPENVQHKLAPTARHAARLFPCLAPTSIEFSQPTTTGEPCTTAARLFAINAFRQLLATVADQRPVLICLDNLQHATPDTIALLADLTSQSQSIRCMIAASICNTTPQIQHINNAFQTTPIQPQIIELPVFTRREARHYIIGAARSLPLKKPKEILKTAHFHPLLIDELIYEQQRQISKTLKTTDKQLELAIDPNPQNTPKPRPPTKPPTKTSSTKTPAPPHQQLPELYQNRLASLSRAERLVLQLITVAYAPLTADLLTKALLTELGSQQFAGQSGALIAEKLVRLRLAHRQSPLVQNNISDDPKTNIDAPQNASYLPPHDIVRQIVLDDIGRDHYTHLCSLIADIIRGNKRSQSSPHIAERQFEYLLRATRLNEASDIAPKIAKSAEQHFAFNRAAEIWRWHLAHTALKTPQTTENLIHLARTEARSGNFDDAANHYQSIAQSLQTPEFNTPENQIHRARLHLHEADAWIHAGHADHAVIALNNALAVFSEHYTSNVLKGSLTGLKVSLLANFSRSHVPASRIYDTTPNAANAAEHIRAQIYQFTIDYNPFLNSTRLRSMQNRLARLAKKTRDTHLNALDRVARIPELHFPSISYASSSPNTGPSADLALSATLFEQIDNLNGLSNVACAHGLRAKRRCQFDDAAQHLERANSLCARANTDTTSQDFRITYALARLHFDQGKLTDAENIARQLLHTHRHDELAKLRAHQLITDICLLRGKIDQAAISLHQTSTSAAALDTSFVHIEIARQSARVNIAQGRPEVAVGHLDMLIDKLHTTRLTNLPPARLLAELTLGQALAALLERQRILEEPRQAQTKKRLAKALKNLRNQRHVTITPALSAEIIRLRARYELLRNKHLKALRILNNAIHILKTTDIPLESARQREAIAIVTLRSDNPEKSDARTELEAARINYKQLDANLPLLLEGWPNVKSITTPGDDTH